MIRAEASMMADLEMAKFDELQEANEDLRKKMEELRGLRDDQDAMKRVAFQFEQENSKNVEMREELAKYQEQDRQQALKRAQAGN